jgi:hypothetical protein
MTIKKVSRRGTFDGGKPIKFGPLMQAFGVSMFVEADKPFQEHMEAGKVRSTPNPNGMLYEYSLPNSEMHMIEVAYSGKEIRYMNCHYCSRNGAPVAFCSHIGHMIRSGYDRGMFRTAYDDGGPDSYLVPIIPTEGVYAQVTLDQVVTKSKRIFTEISVEMINRESGETETASIGIMPELGMFGVNELRYMFVDWATGWMENSLYFHPAGSEPVEVGGIPSVQEINNTTSEFSNRYYLANYGKSIGALVRAPSSSDVPKF